MYETESYIYIYVRRLTHVRDVQYLNDIVVWLLQPVVWLLRLYAIVL